MIVFPIAMLKPQRDFRKKLLQQQHRQKKLPQYCSWWVYYVYFLSLSLSLSLRMVVLITTLTAQAIATYKTVSTILLMVGILCVFFLFHTLNAFSHWNSRGLWCGCWLYFIYIWFGRGCGTTKALLDGFALVVQAHSRDN